MYELTLKDRGMAFGKRILIIFAKVVVNVMGIYKLLNKL